MRVYAAYVCMYVDAKGMKRICIGSVNFACGATAHPGKYCKDNLAACARGK